jgi:predicted acylesterase/phospholipase RssA
MNALIFTAGGAHLNTMLGMLDELDKSKRLGTISAYAGISAGAILASFCATRPVKKAVEQLRSILIEHCSDAIKPHYKYLNIPLSALFQQSILDDSGLANLLEQELEGKIVNGDLYIGVTNETDMKYELHHFAGNTKPAGNLSLVQAVHASMSIPVIFQGEQVKDKHYSDGGVFHQCPVFAIQNMLKRAAEAEQQLQLTILATSPWDYAPEVSTKSAFPLLARRTFHYMDCLQTNNMTTDREILREAFQIYKGKVKVNFKMYMLPSVLAKELHKTFTFTKFSHISEHEIEKLMRLGRNIVRADCATYDVLQNEPSPVLHQMHLKY